MADELPPPPIPDADLSSFKFMPLEVARLRRSKTWLVAKRRPEIGFYALNLWTAAWHERPAGSLENDDDVLADAAMCSPEKWEKAKRDALRGWRLCSNGRLYHPVVAEKVADAATEQARHVWRRECDRIRKENRKRKENNEPEVQLPPEPQRISSRWPVEVETTALEFHTPSHGIPAENALKGKGREGKGEGREREGKGLESYGGADAPPAYAFVGKIIRLNQADFDQWRKAFPAIPDYVAELQAADAYYAEHAPKDGKWFFPVSNWLKKANREALDRKADPVEEQIYRGLD